MTDSGRPREGPEGEPGREARRSKRRAELVLDAVRAVRRRGAGVSVADIASSAGVTKPVLYRFFADRADLQHAVGERAAALLLARITTELRQERQPIELISAVIEAFLTETDEDPELWRFVLRSSVSHTSGPTAIPAVREEIAHRIAAVLNERLGEHGLSREGAQVWAHGLIGLVHVAGTWWMQHRTMSRAALTEQLTALVWGGLSAAHSGSSARVGSTDAAPKESGSGVGVQR